MKEKCINTEAANEKKNSWIPVSSGLYPETNETVLVTYLGYYDKKPICDAVAYRDSKGVWLWALDDTEVRVTITAWKDKGEPYIVDQE